MEEAQLALTTARADQRNFGLWLKNWQIGQTLNALVAAQRPSGELVLRVAGQQLTATADIPVQPGTQLLLEVKQLRPLPLLRILQSVPPAAAAPAQDASPALRQAASAAEASAATAARQLAPLAASAVPAAVHDAVLGFLRLLPRAERLATAEGLRAAVAASGTFAEAHLRAAVDGAATDEAMAPARDRKLQAQRLLAALAQPAAGAPGDGEASAPLLEARGQLEKLLGALQLNQLASLPSEAGAPRSWRLDLPFFLDGDYRDGQLTIREDDPGDGGAGDVTGAAWSAELRLDLARLGLLVARINLAGGQVRVAFEAPAPRAQAALGAGFEDLRRALESRGLAVGALDARPGDTAAPAGGASERGGWQA